MTSPTLAELLAVACPRCGAEPRQECTFVSAHRTAQLGESMGGSCHTARYDALEAAGAPS